MKMKISLNGCKVQKILSVFADIFSQFLSSLFDVLDYVQTWSMLAWNNLKILETDWPKKLISFMIGADIRHFVFLANAEHMLKIM